MESPVSELVERCARAMLDEFCKQRDELNYVGHALDPLVQDEDGGWSGGIILDGKFDMIAAMRVALTAALEPTETMVTAGDCAGMMCVGFVSHRDMLREIYRAMLSAELHIGERSNEGA